MGIRFTACAVAVSVAALVGCGGGSSAENEKIAELEERVEAAESQAGAEADANAAADSSASSEADAALGDVADDAEDVADDAVEEGDSENPALGGSSDCINVPNVVGKDHQLAQDTMQAAGLFYLTEEDASGQGRMLILDRNWTTVKQRPEAGKCVSADTEILLSAVKDDER
jgi:hypothetical protein